MWTIKFQILKSRSFESVSSFNPFLIGTTCNKRAFWSTALWNTIVFLENKLAKAQTSYPISVLEKLFGSWLLILYLYLYWKTRPIFTNAETEMLPAKKLPKLGIFLLFFFSFWTECIQTTGKSWTLQWCKIPLKILAEFCNILDNFAEILTKEKVCAENVKISQIENLFFCQKQPHTLFSYKTAPC